MKGIGEVFLNLMYFYSYVFNHKFYYIKVTDDNEESFYPKNNLNYLKELVIYDPYKESNILTKIFKKSNLLKKVFKYSYFSIY